MRDAIHSGSQEARSVVSSRTVVIAAAMVSHHRSPHTQPRARRATITRARATRATRRRSDVISPRATLRRRRDVTLHLSSSTLRRVRTRATGRANACVDEATEHKTLFGLLFALKDSRDSWIRRTASTGRVTFTPWLLNVTSCTTLNRHRLRFLLTTDVAADLIDDAAHLFKFVRQYVAKIQRSR